MQYVSERREGCLPVITLVLSLIFVGVSVFQQIQITQLSAQVKANQSEVTSLRHDLTITGQKADAALTAIKETQNKEKLCRIPVLGKWLCVLSDLQNSSE